MKVAIIGAGYSGLCAAKHCTQANIAFDVFEQTGNVGGTWYYTEAIGSDENGTPIHTSMYKNIRTNIPKELMALEDFPFLQEQPTSYVPREQVLEYLIKYTQKFNLEPFIKFYTQVLSVNREDRRWLIAYKNTKTKTEQQSRYDSVIVCNGHFSNPKMPQIDGINLFVGPIGHSHDYRRPEAYGGKRVLVIGAGISGLDITRELLSVSEKVYLSHKLFNLREEHDRVLFSDFYSPYYRKLVNKGQVVQIGRNFAIFDDGSREDVDAVLFCTGYRYFYPFLDNASGIRVLEDSCVYPLYKQIVNIENPTMGFIGLCFRTCPLLYDIQVRFFLSTLTGHYKLPNREQMLESLEEDMKNCQGNNINKYHHALGAKMGPYFDSLADEANISRIPPVISKLFTHIGQMGQIRDISKCFRIIDENNFIEIGL